MYNGISCNPTSLLYLLPIFILITTFLHLYYPYSNPYSSTYPATLTLTPTLPSYQLYNGISLNPTSLLYLLPIFILITTFLHLYYQYSNPYSNTYPATLTLTPTLPSYQLHNGISLNPTSLLYLLPIFILITTFLHLYYPYSNPYSNTYPAILTLTPTLPSYQLHNGISLNPTSLLYLLPIFILITTFLHLYYPYSNPYSNTYPTTLTLTPTLPSYQLHNGISLNPTSLLYLLPIFILITTFLHLYYPYSNPYSNTYPATLTLTPTLPSYQLHNRIR